jgi:hypothetical protein
VAKTLQLEKAVNSTAQSVTDQDGNTSPLALSIDKVGIGTPNPLRTLQIGPSIDAAFTFEPADGSPNAGYIRFGDQTGWKLHFGRSRESSAAHSAPLNTGTTGVLMTLQDNGNIGIGTPNPLRTLQIGASIDAAFTFEPADASPNAGYIRFGDQTGWKLHFGRSRESSALHGTPLNTGTTGALMTIQDNGNVGIGTTQPEERLVVDGNIVTTGDIRLTNADCAEDFNIATDVPVEPGFVMVLGEEGELSPSQHAYDKRVAGVISGAGDFKPGIVLDKRQSPGNRQPIALLGKVFCKTDAGYGAIEVGDLLTTSPTRGHAMRADDPAKAFGAVIGKALRPLKEGQGLIPILIALQ